MHVTTVHNRRNEIEVKTKIVSVYFGGGGFFTELDAEDSHPIGTE